MQQAYTFPAPIVSSRPPASSHYAPYTRTSPQTSSRTSSSSSTTSEFKGSSNPSEDWTKISDLAERRRIQNRIAQRNYRKKLKRRLEDLERRAQSRSISPNGEETDGRSTRESSTEQPHGSASTGTTTTTTTTTPALAIDSTPVTTTAYEYTSPAYTTTSSSSSSSTPYPSQYRTCSSLGYSSSSLPSSTYVSAAPLDYSPGPSSGYIYSAYDPSPHSPTDLSVIDPSFILPHPSTGSSSSSSSSGTRIPGVMRTGGMYDVDSSASPYFLSTAYDFQDTYFGAGGISSSFYNLDHLSPLPPLVNTHAASSYSAPQRN